MVPGIDLVGPKSTQGLFVVTTQIGVGTPGSRDIHYRGAITTATGGSANVAAAVAMLQVGSMAKLVNGGTLFMVGIVPGFPLFITVDPDVLHPPFIAILCITGYGYCRGVVGFKPGPITLYVDLVAS